MQYVAAWLHQRMFQPLLTNFTNQVSKFFKKILYMSCREYNVHLYFTTVGVEGHFHARVGNKPGIASETAAGRYNLGRECFRVNIHHSSMQCRSFFNTC